mgnify:CR=1 FL=1
MVRLDSLARIFAEQAHPLVLCHSSRRLANVLTDVNCGGLLNVTTLCEPTGVERIEVDRVHELRHCRLGVSVIATDVKRPTAGVGRRAGAVARMVEVQNQTTKWIARQLLADSA